MADHGVVMFARQDVPHAVIWQMAMSHGYFIAVYTSRSTETSTEFSTALVPTPGEPLHFPTSPDLGGNYHEYARYEPDYDEQFCRLCDRCTEYHGWPTVALPSTASDHEAVRLLGELDSIQVDAWPYLQERFYVQRRHNLRKPKRTQLRLADLFKVLRLNDKWAYFVGCFRSGDGVVVFLSDDQSDVDDLFEQTGNGPSIVRQAEWREYWGVIEKW